jgi:hypothetical protein
MSDAKILSIILTNLVHHGRKGALCSPQFIASMANSGLKFCVFTPEVPNDMVNNMSESPMNILAFVVQLGGLSRPYERRSCPPVLSTVDGDFAETLGGSPPVSPAPTSALLLPLMPPAILSERAIAAPETL